MHLGKINTKGPVKGGQWLEPLPAAQGTGDNPPWTGCPFMAGHTNVHTLTRGPLRNALHFMCASLG